MPDYKPVGIDENSKFPPRVEQRLAADVADPGTPLGSSLNDTFGRGFGLVIPAGQSLAGGTGATYDPSIDDDFEGLYWWGATPGSAGFHQINPLTSMPLPGGLITTRGYGLMGSVITARMLYRETGIPQLIIPVFAGGMGFYSYNTVRGSWLVGGRTDGSGSMPNAAQLSVDEINLAIEAASAYGPVRDCSIIWNQGEADRDVTTSEADYAEALDDLIAKWRTEIDYDNAATVPVIVARQLPERRAVDGPSKAGVDLAQLDTPGRVPFTAVIHPPDGYANADNTHANAAGQRIMGRLYREALDRARMNRPSLAATPVVNLAASTSGVLTWEPPATGRNEGFSVRFRANGGAWSTPETVLAGVREFIPTGVPSGVEVTFEVTTLATAGNSKPATATPPGVITGLMFDFNADDLALTDGTALAANNWQSRAGNLPGLAFTGVGGTAPTCEVNDAALPGHRLVRFVSGSLAVPVDTLSNQNGTYLVLVRMRAGSTGDEQVIFAGAGGGEHYLYAASVTNNFGFRQGSPGSGGGVATAPFVVGEWCVVICRKDGTDYLVIHEDASGDQFTNGVATNTDSPQTLIALSSVASRRAQMDVHRVMAFDYALSDEDVAVEVQAMFENAGLR